MLQLSSCQKEHHGVLVCKSQRIIYEFVKHIIHIFMTYLDIRIMPGCVLALSLPLNSPPPSCSDSPATARATVRQKHFRVQQLSNDLPLKLRIPELCPNTSPGWWGCWRNRITMLKDAQSIFTWTKPVAQNASEQCRHLLLQFYVVLQHLTPSYISHSHMEVS